MADELDMCDECREYGYDYYIDEKGKRVSACDNCPFNPTNDEEE